MALDLWLLCPTMRKIVHLSRAAAGLKLWWRHAQYVMTSRVLVTHSTESSQRLCCGSTGPIQTKTRVGVGSRISYLQCPVRAIKSTLADVSVMVSARLHKKLSIVSRLHQLLHRLGAMKSQYKAYTATASWSPSQTTVPKSTFQMMQNTHQLFWGTDVINELCSNNNFRTRRIFAQHFYNP